MLASELTRYEDIEVKTISSEIQTADVPCGNATGFFKYFKYDIVSGLLVFLIALPLCLGISVASGYPPIAGIFTAIIGSLTATLLSNSELTIKGPAASLIVIVVGCIEAFGGNGMIDGWSQVDTQAYRAALAIGVVAAALQILFGFLRAGILGEFFPISTVQGMLAAIGVVSILIMFLWPIAGQKIGFLKACPSPLIVLLVAVPMGMAFDLKRDHSYTLQSHEYQVSDQYLVAMPDRVFGMFDEITGLDFSALRQPKAWTWVFLFFIIGSLESLLGAKAVELTMVQEPALPVFGTACLCWSASR